MDEQATRVSPLNKSGGGNKTRESPQSGGKLVPHYLRPSKGSCHEFCKHGRQEDQVVVGRDSRPWRKPSPGKCREDGGVAAIVKKTVAVKSKPSANDETLSLTSEDTRGQEMSTTTENIDLHSEESSLYSTTAAMGEMCTSDGPETESTFMSAEKVKQETAKASVNITVASEGVPLDAKDINDSKKQNTSPSVKPPMRSPSPVFRASTVGRSVDRRKSIDGRKSLNGIKAFDGRKSADESKNDEVGSTADERMSFIDGKRIVPETTEICDGNGDNAENNIKDSISAVLLTSIEGSKSSAGSNGSEERKSLKLKGNKKDDNLGNAKIHGKSELPKKQVAVPTPKILKMKSIHSLNPIAAKPPSPLHPSSSPSQYPVAGKPPSPLHPSSAPSRVLIAAKPPSPLHPLSAPSHHPIAAKPPSPLHPSSALSRNHMAAKHSSPLLPSSSTCSKITDDEVATQHGTSKLKMNKVGTVASPSSRPSVNGEEINVLKIVKVKRVVSTIRRQRRIISVAAKDPDDQGLKKDNADASEIALAKNSMLDPNEEASRDSLLPIAPSISRISRIPTAYAVTSRISNGTSRSKNLPAEDAKKIASKDAYTPGPRKTKAVDLQSGNHRPSTLKAGRVSLIGETARITRSRSLKKRIVAGSNAIEKNTSGRILSRRPSSRQKKNVQVLFNKVIEETANRLVRTSKSKVLALVGAFETVISIQRKSSSATTPKSKKTSSS